MTKMRQEKTEINKIKVGKGDITTNPNKNWRIIIEYCEITLDLSQKAEKRYCEIL
jgi:hypothetical protein